MYCFLDKVAKYGRKKNEFWRAEATANLLGGSPPLEVAIEYIYARTLKSNHRYPQACGDVEEM